VCTSWVEYISNINIVVLVTSDAFEWVCSDNERRISRLGRCGCRVDIWPFFVSPEEGGRRKEELLRRRIIPEIRLYKAPGGWTKENGLRSMYYTRRKLV